MLATERQNSRRHIRRRGSPHIKPLDTSVRIKKDTLEDVDALIPIPTMPLGLKIESIVRAYRRFKAGDNQKNQIGQEITSPSAKQSLLYEGNWTDEELRILEEAGWT
jgi:hypothetical protein